MIDDPDARNQEQALLPNLDESSIAEVRDSSLEVSTLTEALKLNGTVEEEKQAANEERKGPRQVEPRSSFSEDLEADTAMVQSRSLSDNTRERIPCNAALGGGVPRKQARVPKSIVVEPVYPKFDRNLFSQRKQNDNKVWRFTLVDTNPEEESK